MENTESLGALLPWLDAHLNFEKLPQKNVFWLDTMRFLCGRFSNPQDCAPSLHVAGSKGKGSVATFIASILDAAGFRTGLYTSPHIVDFRERVTMCHEPFAPRVYADAARELMEGVARAERGGRVRGRPVTWFELATLFAFLVFRRARVDFSVFEVGMGGRLDATNVVTPLASVITPIELEHTEFLGGTVEQIAAEKGGIIKERVPVVVSGQRESVRAVLGGIAREKGAPAYFFGDLVESLSCEYVKNAGWCAHFNAVEDEMCAKKDTLSRQFDGDSVRMDVRFRSPLFSRPLRAQLRLLGRVQAENAALAACAAKIAVPGITEGQVERGLAKAFVQGRFEIVRSAAHPGVPAVVLDGAHTVRSCALAVETLGEVFGRGRAFALLFACAQDKDAAEMAPLFRGASAVFLTVPGRVKKSDLKAVERAFSDCAIAFDSDEDFVAQTEKALRCSEARGLVLLVAGSFYLVGEVKKALAPPQPDCSR